MLTLLVNTFLDFHFQRLLQPNVFCRRWPVSLSIFFFFFHIPHCKTQPVDRSWRDIWHEPSDSGLTKIVLFDWYPDWLDKSCIRIFFIEKFSLVFLLLCLVSLFSCRTHYRPSFKSLTDRRFWSRIHSWIISSHPGPKAEKAVPDLNISTGMIHCWNEVLCLLCSVSFSPSMALFIVTKHFYHFFSSVQRMDFQRASGLSNCFSTMFKRTALFFVESRDYF